MKVTSPVRFEASALASFTHKAKSLMAVVAGVSLLSSPGVHALIISDDVDFSVVYNASALPSDSTPKWTLLPGASTAVGTAQMEADALVMNTPAAGARYYQISNNTIWNGATSTGSTIEFSLKVESMASGASNATIFYLSNGSKGYAFYFRPNEISYNGGANPPVHAFDTTSDFNRYRITLSSDGLASLYVNNDPTPLIANHAGAAVVSNHIYFGDASGSAGGIVHWEYVAFTNSAMVAPIPEGKTASLILVGGLLLWGGLRRTKSAVGRGQA